MGQHKCKFNWQNLNQKDAEKRRYTNVDQKDDTWVDFMAFWGKSIQERNTDINSLYNHYRIIGGHAE